MATTGMLRTRLTAEELVDLEIPKEVRISPSGKQVAYSVSPFGHKGDHKTSAIWLAKVGKEKSARQLSSGSFNDRTPQWSPNGESIAFLSDRTERGNSCAIYVLHIIGGGEPFPVTSTENEREISDFAWSPDGNLIAFLSADEKTAEKKAKENEKDDVMLYGENWDYNRLRLLHVSTRMVTNLYKEDAHVNSFAWSGDSKRIAYVLHDTPEVDSPRSSGVTIEAASVASKSRMPLSKFPGAITSSVTWSGDELYFLAGALPDKCNTSSMVYHLSVEDKRWSKYAYGDKSCATGITCNGGLVTIKVLSGLSDEVHLLDNTSLYADQHEILTWDAVKLENGNFVIVVGKSTVSSSYEICSLYISGDESKNDLVQLTDHGQLISPHNLGTAETLHCVSSDATINLNGLFLSPSSSQPDVTAPRKPLPTVVIIHGGPYYRTTISFDTSFYYWSPLLLSSGRYGVLSPNYRGGSSHGEKFASYARGGMGTVDYDDIISLIDHGIKEGLVDKERIVVGGLSQGGFLTYLLAVRHNSQRQDPNNKNPSIWTIKGAICGEGIVDWDMMSMTSDSPTFEAELAHHAPWQKPPTTNTNGQPTEKSDTSARHGSAIWEMAKAKGNIPPVLILHGERDERVPLTQAVAFQRGCAYWGVPCEMAVYPREGHIFRERAHLVDILKRVNRFVDMCLS